MPQILEAMSRFAPQGLDHLGSMAKILVDRFGIVKKDPVPKPTDIEIGDFLANLGYQNAVYTSCSIYRGMEKHMRDAGRIGMKKTDKEHNSPGIAGGLALGGRRTILMSQNSAMFNEGDGIFTFLSPRVNDIPVLILTSWRRDKASEPHYEMGKVTKALSNILFPRDSIFGNEDGSDFLNELGKADQVVRSGHMALVLMPEEAFERAIEPVPEIRSEGDVTDISDQYKRMLAAEEVIASKKGTFTETNPFPTNRIFDRFEAAQLVVDYYRKKYTNVRFIGSNGFNARTLLAIYGDDPHFLLLPGYMGGASAVGEGSAEARSDVHFVVLNGNENNQMSAMANHLKTEYPDNLDIVTFNDEAGSSVGGAPSRPLTSDDYNYSRVIQIYPSDYRNFTKDIDRITESPRRTRAFAESLRAVPRAA